jgi:hypothetical protein
MYEQESQGGEEEGPRDGTALTMAVSGRNLQGGSMETKKFDCQFYLAINEDGEFVVTTEEDSALSNLADSEGGYYGQIYEINLKVAGAKAQVITAELPEPKGEAVEIAIAE